MNPATNKSCLLANFDTLILSKKSFQNLDKKQKRDIFFGAGRGYRHLELLDTSLRKDPFIFTKLDLKLESP